MGRAARLSPGGFSYLCPSSRKALSVLTGSRFNSAVPGRGLRGGGERCQRAGAAGPRGRWPLGAVPALPCPPFAGDAAHGAGRGKRFARGAASSGWQQCGNWQVLCNALPRRVRERSLTYVLCYCGLLHQDPCSAAELMWMSESSGAALAAVIPQP